MTETLFAPFTAGSIALANRIVMAPLTRNRARREDDVPTDLAVEYYRQRATAGLIISEGSQISPQGKGYAWTPGIHSGAQVDAWRKITAAVHGRGGKIAIQLWHVGRVSHKTLQPGGQAPVAPSAIAAATRVYDGERFVAASLPRALDTTEIAGIVADYAQATRNAREAGFDAVEIHGANGYLVHQFLCDGSNKRGDAYGGGIENRARFLFEVVDAVAGAWDAGHVGIRISPFSNANDVADSDPMALFSHVVQGLDQRGIAFLHVIEGQTGGTRDLPGGCDLGALRAMFRGAYIGNNGYDRASAIAAVESGSADLVAFGRAFIANPDLVARLRQDAPLNEPDKTTFYGGGATGYIDYPALAG